MEYGLTSLIAARANLGKYFEEADNYPLIIPTAEMNFNSSSQIYDMNVNPTANYFLNINLLPSPEIFLQLLQIQIGKKQLIIIHNLWIFHFQFLILIFW